jgi:hypothetical protein
MLENCGAFGGTEILALVGTGILALFGWNRNPCSLVVLL